MTDDKFITDITNERRSVYGPFLHNAIVSQAVKEAFRSLPDPDNDRRWLDLPTDIREALDLIALKISRIVTGTDPEYLDHWDDIAGYVRCITDRIRAKRVPRDPGLIFGKNEGPGWRLEREERNVV